MKKSISACLLAVCSVLVLGWNSVSELEAEASLALATPTTLLNPGFSNKLHSAIQSTNQIIRIDAELVQSIVYYQQFLNSANGRLIDSGKQCLSNVVDLTAGMTNSWRFWTGRLLLASTHAADNDFETAYQMSTNYIQMLQDYGGLQETNILGTAILAYYEMTNANIDVAFKVFAGMSSAGIGMGNAATNYASQVPMPYRNVILEFVR